jgi:hypothetical protein
MTGYIRVGNKHGGKEILAEGEAMVSVDRGTDFGNPWPLRDAKDDAARNLCCDRFARMADRDMAVHGPIWRAVQELARRVMDGERIVLMCWCTPKRCHGHYIAMLVERVVAQLTEAKNERMRRAVPARRTGDAVERRGNGGPVLRSNYRLDRDAED